MRPFRNIADCGLWNAEFKKGFLALSFRNPKSAIRNHLLLSGLLLTCFLLTPATLGAAYEPGSSPKTPRPNSPPRPTKYLETEKDPFRITYPQGENIQEAAGILVKAQKQMESRYGYVPRDWVPVIFYATAKEFQEATNKPSWMAALVRKDGLHFQPIRALRAKGSLQVVLTHEYTHWVQNALTNYTCPHWLAEGLAILESGEGAEMEKEFAQEKNRRRPSLRQIEREIKNSQDQKKVRLAYFRAYQFSYYLEYNFGISKVGQFLRGLGEGKDPNAAAAEVFGYSLDELVEYWRKGGQ